MKLNISIRKISRIYKWEYFWLTLIVLISITMHLIIITPPGLPFVDERYYVTNALSISNQHSDLHPEHPPLGKLFIIAGIKIFGDNPVGWRFFSILFGSLSLILFYLICRKLSLSRISSSIAVYLLAFENLTFIQSSIGMLDVFMYFFMLLSFVAYLNNKNVYSGLFVGLSALVKINGILAGSTILTHLILTNIRKVWRRVLIIIASIVGSFLLFMTIFEYIINQSFISPIGRLFEIINLSRKLTYGNTKNEFLSRPIEWILQYKHIPYWYNPDYNGAISQSIWIMIIPVALYLTYKAIKKNNAGIFGISWFVNTYFFWIIISLLFNRSSYIYYFYPTIGAVCLGIGLAINDLLKETISSLSKYKEIIIISIITYLILHFIFFVKLSPFFSFF